MLSITHSFFKIFCAICVFLLVGSEVNGSEKFTVVIDPGHGGADPGAHRYTVREKDLTLKVAKKLETLLIAQNINVVMTRSYDKTLSLTQRANIANKYKNSLFVSIHFNAALKGMESVNGIETFYMSSRGKKLANTIQKELLKKLNAGDRKIKFNKYKVLEKTHSPAVLVECGFISNYRERQYCNRSWYQSLCASAIAKGIMQYRKVM